MKYSRSSNPSGIFNNIRTIFTIGVFLFIYLLIYHISDAGIYIADKGNNQHNNLIKWLGYLVMIIGIVIFLKW